MIHHEKLYKNQDAQGPNPLRVVPKDPTISTIKEPSTRNDLEVNMLKKSNASLKSFNEKLQAELSEATEKLFHM